MRSLLQQLENNESVLLMYLADELPPEDRAEVDQMLSTDSGLRRELSKLKGLSDSFTLSMTGLDGMEIPATTQLGVARKVSRLMAQQAVREAVHSVPEARPSSARRWRIGGWVYPVGVAAVILLAVGWWGRQPTGVPRGSVARHTPENSHLSQELAIPPIVPTDPTTSVAGSGFGNDVFELTDDLEIDRTMVAVAASAVDVSSMFELDADGNTRRDNAPQ